MAKTAIKVGKTYQPANGWQTAKVIRLHDGKVAYQRCDGAYARVSERQFAHDFFV